MPQEDHPRRGIQSRQGIRPLPRRHGERKGLHDHRHRRQRVRGPLHGIRSPHRRSLPPPRGQGRPRPDQEGKRVRSPLPPRDQTHREDHLHRSLRRDVQARRLRYRGHHARHQAGQGIHQEERHRQAQRRVPRSPQHRARRGRFRFRQRDPPPPWESLPRT